MNRKFIFYTVGRIAQVVGLLMLLPAVVSLVYQEIQPLVSFVTTAVVSILLGTLLTLICRTKNNIIYAKEGFVIVALAWLGMSAIGAIPFVLSGDIPFYVDALFETVSGFTTTGASVVTNVEALSHGGLFWRSFTHWVGGMGVLVFVMAIISNMTDRSIHIMRAEMPGHVVGKLVPRGSDTAKILYLIYIVLTVALFVLLCIGGMPAFDSMLHAFASAGTGGFGIKYDSVASYSPFCQNVISTFLLLFGINFNLYYLLLIRRFKSVFKSAELWVYLGIVAVSVGVISSCLHFVENIGIADSLRLAYFQVVSIITTAGFSTANYDLWPALARGVLFSLMFLGGCAGSTAGGLKISRVVIMFKLILREIKRMLHPRAVTSVKFEGRAVNDQTLSSVSTYFAVYALCIISAFLLVCFEKVGDATNSFETNFTAVIATFNNIGPGFGDVGPMGSYADYSVFTKFVFCAGMLLGRLEIFPLVIALSPSTWKKSR